AFTRRKLITSLGLGSVRALCLLTLLAALSCKQSETKVTATVVNGVTATPRAGGQLVFGFDGAAVSQFKLDPHTSLYAPHHRVMRSIYDSLVVALPNHSYGPWLAQSWEVAADGLSYTFHLRENVQFHDGTPCDAAAVKFNFDRIKDPQTAAYSVVDIGTYESATVIDPLTVRIQFSQPFAPFLSNLARSTLGIVSPTAVNKYGADFPLHPVGTGPFQFKSLQPATEIVLERNANYQWPPAGSAHTGAPWLERVVFKNVPEEATRVAVLANGQAGAVDLIPPQNLVSLRNDKAYRVIEGELLNQNYSLYLNTARPPWNEPRMREAFRLTLDLDSAVKTIYLGTQARAWSPLSPSLLGYDKSLEHSWQPDKAAAARILDELGWKPGPDGVRVKDGKRLTLAFLDTQGNREKRLDLVTVLRRQLRDNGFDLRVDSQPAGLYQAKTASGDYDALGASQFATDPDVLRRLHSPRLRSTLSVARTDDPELTQLLEDGSLELDVEKRKQIYARIQHIIVERGYAFPAYVLLYSIATAERVQGIRIDPHGFPVFYDTWLRELEHS
ncbi:MAG: hypothetical protein RL701_587, partial [Pseudomonadota bacterium]